MRELSYFMLLVVAVLIVSVVIGLIMSAISKIALGDKLKELSKKDKE